MAPFSMFRTLERSSTSEADQGGYTAMRVGRGDDGVGPSPPPPLSPDLGPLLLDHFCADHLTGQDDFHAAVQLAPCCRAVVRNGVVLAHPFRGNDVR
jgi:hypothetical protein